MKKLITILMLLCSVASVWGQDDFGKQQLAKAQAGDAKAQHLVGFGYANGAYGFPKDENEAFKWYKKSAEQDFAEGQDDLGRCYMWGKGVAKDEEEAVRWHRKAAAQGYEPSMYCLGLYYEDINKDEAIYWFKKNMDAWYAEYGKEHKLAAKRLRELGVKYKPKTKNTTNLFASNSSSNGSSTTSTNPTDAEKQFDLGVDCYEQGNYAEAVKWFTKAAEQGLAQAQCNLGMIYYNGDGVQQDLVEAAKWFRKAADQGDASAQYNMGFCYENGQGVQQDFAEAAKWYRKAAEQGNTSAQLALGAFYENGQGVQKDSNEAIAWFKKSMDSYYLETGTELKEAANALKRLGVTYHPNN